MSAGKRILLLILIVTSFIPVFAQVVPQQVPFNPISFRIYTPFLINPAIAGNKDFFSADFLAGFSGKSYSQCISANTRIPVKSVSYIGTSPVSSFTNFGAGIYAFNDFNSIDSTHTAGGAIGLSYHYPINKTYLYFLSIGASAKGMYHFFNGDSELGQPSKEFYFPNFDAGIYFYGPGFYTGVSATNILGAPEDTVTINKYTVPVSRHYHFLAGYKIVLSRQWNLVLEPSVMIVTNDSLDFNIKESLQPLIKFYAGNFCLGTYFNDYNKISFFFQYRYPRFYVGTFFALPKDTPYFKKSLTAEIAVGINFSKNGAGYNKSGHW